MTGRRVPATTVGFGQQEREAVLRVLDSGRVVQGAEVAAFEDEFAKHVDGRSCVAVNSGTSALHLALLASGIGRGDEVIVPSFSFAATANAVVMAGATPVFADIDLATYCLDPDAVAAKVTSRTAAIMPVHLYGHPAGMPRLREIASRDGLLLVEDAAQAHGAALDGAPAGALGDVAAFSFYATKNMTTGEGGMVVCADEDVARRVRLLRNQGMERQYHNEVAGLNNRMTDIAAAIGRVQLTSLPAWNERRREVASRYSTGLGDLVATPVTGPGVVHAFHQYTLRVTDRDALLARLEDQGIEARVFYPVPIHELPAYRTEDHLPTTAQAIREVLSLPIRPTLTDDDVDHVVRAVREAVEERA